MLELLNQMDGFDSMGDVKVQILTGALQTSSEDKCCPCCVASTALSVLLLDAQTADSAQDTFQCFAVFSADRHCINFECLMTTC